MAMWKHLLWSEEATFSVASNRAKNIYQRPGSDVLYPKFTCHTARHPDSLIVWVRFGYSVVEDLVLLPRNITMNQFNYLELLSEYIPKSAEKCQTDVFMQDGASCHMAKAMTRWLWDCHVRFIEN